jgi:SAM-dependent methyltransferase
MVADSFYEEGETDGTRSLYRVHVKGDRPFALAGLWDYLEHVPGAGEFCTLVTTRANRAVSSIRDRMPAIIPPDGYDLWLDPTIRDPARLRPLLDAWPSGETEIERLPPMHERFASVYHGRPPWDIDGPQPAFVLLEKAGAIRGAVLDVGCGTGENALYFASRGYKVCGIDYVPLPIERARAKAIARGLSVDFRVANALELQDLGREFDTVIDCGLFHLFSDKARAAYLSSLARVLRPGGRFHMLCFSDLEPPGEGPRRVSKLEIYHGFREGWKVEDVQGVTIENLTDLELPRFSPGGPRGWLVSVVRGSF